MNYRMRFRFADAEEMRAFGESLFWLFLFSEVDRAKSYAKKGETSYIMLTSPNEHHFRYLTVMAWEYKSFRGSDITPDV